MKKILAVKQTKLLFQNWTLYTVQASLAIHSFWNCKTVVLILLLHAHRTSSPVIWTFSCTVLICCRGQSFIAYYVNKVRFSDLLIVISTHFLSYVQRSDESKGRGKDKVYTLFGESPYLKPSDTQAWNWVHRNVEQRAPNDDKSCAEAGSEVRRSIAHGHWAPIRVLVVDTNTSQDTSFKIL